MTERAEFLSYRSRSRDIQDSMERHVFGKITYVDGAGAVIKVRGTDTTDEEVPVISLGQGVNYPENSDVEVFLLSLSSDTNQKFALVSLPRDKQHKWAEGTGGIQHPTDPERRVEFNGDETWLKDGEFKAGPNKEITISVSGGVVTISTPEMEINTNLKVNGNVDFTGGHVKHNGKDIGDTHEHTNVTPGAGNSGPPA